MSDSCTVNFRKQNDLVIRFNLCSETTTELSPEMNKWNLASIDSIQMYSDSLNKTYQLSLQQIKKFVNEWNQRRTNGYSEQPFDSAFSKNPVYGSYYYQFTIFSNKAPFPSGRDRGGTF